MTNEFRKATGNHAKGQKTYLHVPYEEKDTAKGLGARWDAERKQWYCLGKTKRFKRWMKPIPKYKPGVGVAQSRVRQFAYQ